MVQMQYNSTSLCWRDTTYELPNQAVILHQVIYRTDIKGQVLNRTDMIDKVCVFSNQA